MLRARIEQPSSVRAADRSGDVFWAVLLGLLSAALYLALYLFQGALYRNGLGLGFGELLGGGVPADPARLRLEAAGYYGTTLALFGLYVSLLLSCRRGRFRGRQAQGLLLLFPALFHIGLLFGRPYLSIDIFSYMAHGYLGTLPDANPYLQAAAEVADTPFGPQLVSFGWIPVHPPSPYGPLWTTIEIGILRLTSSVPVAMLLLKAVVVAASLGTAALIWSILGRVRPEQQLLGTLVYAWNPVVITEFAAEGHNDALMILFVLAALAATVAVRPAPALLSLALGVLTKYLPLIFLPAQLLFLLRARRSWRQLIPGLLVGGLLAAAAAVALYRPLWVGADTFQGLRGAGTVFESPSPAGLLYGLLARTREPEAASQLATTILGGLFAAFVLLVSWRVPDTHSLLQASALIALGYVLVASPSYWPWYAALPVALLALTPRPVFVWIAVILSLCSRLVAPLSNLASNGFVEWTTALALIPAVGVTLPLVLALALALWSRATKTRMDEG